MQRNWDGRTEFRNGSVHVRIKRGQDEVGEERVTTPPRYTESPSALLRDIFTQVRGFGAKSFVRDSNIEFYRRLGRKY